MDSLVDLEMTLLKNLFTGYSKKNTIAATLLAALFVVQFSVFDYAKRLSNAGLTILCTAILYALAWLVLQQILKLAVDGEGWIAARLNLTKAEAIDLSQKETAVQTKKHQNINPPFWICFLIVLITAIVFLFSAIPGIWTSDDVAAVWRQVTEHEWRAWHTFGYQLFVALCKKIYPSTFTVNIVHTIIWLALQFVLLRKLGKSSRPAMVLYTVLLEFTVIEFLYLEVMYKDVVFSLGMLSFMAWVLIILYTDEITFFDFIFFSATTCFATLCRHAGWVPIFATYAFLLLHYLIHKKKKLLLQVAMLLLIQIIALFTVNYALTYKFRVIPNSNISTYGVPMAMIAGALANGVELNEEDTWCIELVMPTEAWAASYDDDFADSVCTGNGIGDAIYTAEDLLNYTDYGKELVKINARIFIHHPIIYCKCFFKMCNIIWEINEPLDTYNWAVCTVAHTEDINFTPLYTLTQAWTMAIYNCPFLNAICYRGGLSLFVLILSAAIFILRKQYKYLLGVFPILLYDVLLSLGIKAEDPRFILPTIECALFLIAFLVMTQGKSSEEDREKLESKGNQN